MLTNALKVIPAPLPYSFLNPLINEIFILGVDHIFLLRVLTVISHEEVAFSPVAELYHNPYEMDISFKNTNG